MKTKKYPIFEPDQVLTSTHLNMLVTYLEEQDRLSRNKLHGIGVVCGFKVSRETNNSGNTSSILISKGVGITSAGYLINLEDSVCASYRKYTDAAKYDRWIVNEKQVELLELLTNEDVEDLAEDVEVKKLTGLSEAQVQQLAVVLYLERLDVDLKNCTPDDCNDKGTERQFRVRKLLVSKQHLRTLIADEHGLDPDASEASLEAHINMRHHLRELKLQPFRPPRLDEVQVEHIVGQFNVRIRQAIPPVSSAVADVLKVHEDLLNHKKINTSPASNLQQKLFDKQGQLEQTNAPGLQYLYDHLFDLRDAYEELRQKSFELVSACCPDENLFPLHLMVGEVIPADDCAPSIYRHHFIKAPYHGNQQHLKREIAGLLRRLILLIEGFEVPQVQEVKITPSQDADQRLSHRAIPYYYNNVNGDKNLYKYWNQEFLRPCEYEQNLSFHASKYADNLEPAAKDQLLNPLKYDLNEYGFFRVEGHIGKAYTGVLQTITQQQQIYNLPFDVVAVKLGKYYDEAVLGDFECYFQDIEAEYRLMREEMQCFANKNGGYFLSLKYIPEEADTGGANTGGTGVITNVEFLPLYSAIKWTGATTKKSTTPTTKKTGTITNRALVYDFGEDTVGNIFKKEIARKKEVPQELLMSELAKNFAGILKIPLDGLVTRIQYPLLIANALDELEATLKTAESIRQLDVKELDVDYQKLIRTAEQFSTAIRKNLKNPDLQPLGNEEDIINRLEDIIYNCQIRRFIALRAEYDRRVKKLSEQFLFHNFANSHSGLEHRGGVPRGGTFVLVYYDQATYRPPRVNLREAGILNRATNVNEANGGNEITSLMMRSAETTERGTTAVDTERLMRAANTFRPSNSLMNLFPGSFSLNLPNLDVTRFTNKVVVADFCLDYICCSQAPPVSYVFPPAADTQIILSLPQNEFCSPDPQNSRYPFTANPAGGELKGPGVEKDANGNYFFNPSAADVEAGQATFTYLVDGRSATLSVVVGKSPKLDFVKRAVEMTENGLFVAMANESESGDVFTWELAGEKIESRNLNITLPDFTGDKIQITLRGTSGRCSSSLTKEFEVETGQEQVTLSEANNRTSFCFDNQEVIELIANPPGGTIKAPSGITLNQTNRGFRFMPAETNPGSYKLVYTSPDGNKAELTIEVVKPNAAFDVKPIRAANNIIQVQLIPEMTDAKSYEWTVMGQVVSNEPQPKIALDFSNAHSLEVGLRVTKAGCAASNIDKANRDNLMSELGNNGPDPTEPTRILDVTKKDLQIVTTNLKKMSTIASFREIMPETSTLFKQNMTFYDSVNKELSKAATLKAIKNASRNRVTGKRPDHVAGWYGQFIGQDRQSTGCTTHVAGPVRHAGRFGD